MKIYMINHRSYIHNLSSCEIKARKKFRPERQIKWPAPSGLIAQLLVRCTGIAKVKGSNAGQA